MDGKINVMDIEIDNFTSKEAVKRSIEYMQSEPLNTVEMVTAQNLMQIDEVEGLSEEIGQFDMVLPGDAAILEVAGISEKAMVSETKKHRFLKVFLQYLHKNHKRVYLLVDTEEMGQNFLDYVEHEYRGIEVVGLARVSAANRGDDMLVNAMNGAEADCVLSLLDSPVQEEFILQNRSRINARLWLSIGKEILTFQKESFWANRIGLFLIRKIFQKEVERRKIKNY